MIKKTLSNNIILEALKDNKYIQKLKANEHAQKLQKTVNKNKLVSGAIAGSAVGAGLMKLSKDHDITRLTKKLVGKGKTIGRSIYEQ